MDRRNDTDAELAASVAMQGDDVEEATIGDFLRLTGGLWIDPTAVIGGRVIATPGVPDSFSAQLIMMEVGWVTVSSGTQDECDVILRQALLDIYNERR